MFNDALSIWNSAKARVGATITSISASALEGVEGEDQVEMDEELQAYMRLLEEAQMQHVELSKQMRLLLAEKDAEITALRSTYVAPCSGSGATSSLSSPKSPSPPSHLNATQRDEVVLNARVEVEKSRSERAALADTLQQVEAQLRLALQDQNAADILRKKAATIQTKYEHLIAEHKGFVREARNELKQKTDTIDSLVQEYSHLASDTELRTETQESLVNKILRENEILATKLSVMELNITELADGASHSHSASTSTSACAQGSSRGSSKGNDAQQQQQQAELSHARAAVLGLEMDLKDKDIAFAQLRLELEELRQSQSSAKIQTVEMESATAVQEQAETYKLKIQELQAQIDTQCIVESAANDSMNTLRATCTALEQELIQCKDTLGTSEATVRLLKNDIADHVATVASLQMQDIERNSLTEELMQLKSTMSNQEDVHKATLVALEKKHIDCLGTLEDQHQAVLAKHNAEVALSKQENTVSVEAHASAIARITQEAATASSAAKQMAQQLQALVDEKVHALDKAESSAQEWETQCKKLKADLAAALASATAQSESGEQQEYMRAQLTRDLQIAQSNLADTQSKLELALEMHEKAQEASKIDAEERQEQHSREIMTITNDLTAVVVKHKNEVAQLSSDMTSRNSESELKFNSIIDAQKAAEEAHKVEVKLLKDTHDTEVARLSEEHKTKMTSLSEEHKNRVKSSDDQHDTAVAELRLEHDAEVKSMTDNHSSEVRQINEEHKIAYDSCKREYDAEVDRLIDTHTNEAKRLTDTHMDDIQNLGDEHKAITKVIKDEHEAELIRINKSNEKAIRELTTTQKAHLLAAQKEAASFEMKAEDLQESLDTLNVNMEEEREATKKMQESLNQQLSAEKVAVAAALANIYELQSSVNSLEQELATAQAGQSQAERAQTLALTELANLNAEVETRITQATDIQKVQCAKDIASAISEANAEKDKYVARYTKENVLRKKIHNKLLELQGNIRVICRVRPILEMERRQSAGEDVDVTELPNEQDIVVTRDEGQQKTKFEYDRVYGPVCSQTEVFDSVRPLCVSVLDGYNVCIFAYGQTGSGKTFTMEGNVEDPGMSPRAIHALFQEARDAAGDTCDLATWNFTFKFSVLEIYNETILDLLNSEVVGEKGDKKNLKKIRQELELRQTGKDGAMSVVGLTAVDVSCGEEVDALLVQAQKNRAVGSHDMNEHSSRSHCILTLTAFGTNSIDGSKSFGKMHLIDLAGSERISKTDATGDRLKEAQNINRSLSALGDVIAALGSKKGTHIPYRNSKLTHLLQDSLGGNSKVMMFVNISPAVYNVSETVCSLTFATRCRNVELGQARKQISAASSRKADISDD